MKLYKIIRISPSSVHVMVVNTINKETYQLKHVGTHGSGFNFGYPGSGPADLAWSLLADALSETDLSYFEQQSGDFLSNVLHQRYKEDVIAGLSEQREHFIYEMEIHQWIRKNYQGIDIPTYLKRRQEFRHAQEQMDRVEEINALNEKVTEADMQLWRNLMEVVDGYRDWLKVQHSKYMRA